MTPERMRGLLIAEADGDIFVLLVKALETEPGSADERKYLDARDLRKAELADTLESIGCGRLDS